MREYDFLLKTRSKWLEIEKSSKNKPAVVLSQKFGLSRNIKKYPFLENSIQREKDAVYTDVAVAISKTNIYPQENLLEINLRKSSFMVEILLSEKDIISNNAVAKDWVRGIFMDSSKELPSILVNTKNHLDIIAFSPFGKEAETLAKLNEIDDILGKELLFAYDSHLGFLTSNPEECGSGLFVETIVHLPALVLTEEINEVLNGISIIGARAEGVFNENAEAWGAFFRITMNFSGVDEYELIEKTKEMQKALIAAESKARKLLFKEARLVMEDKIYRSFAMLKYSRIMTVSQLFNFFSLLRLGAEQKIFPMNLKTLNLLFERGWTGNMLLSLKETPTDFDELRANILRNLLEEIDF